MENQPWRKEPRKNYSNEFKLRMVKLSSRSGPCVAQIACGNGINDDIIFKWMRLWQDEGRISLRLPATVESSPSSMMLSVEAIPDPVPKNEMNAYPGQFPTLNAISCCVEFRHCKMTLENPPPELLAVLLRDKHLPVRQFPPFIVFSVSKLIWSIWYNRRHVIVRVVQAGSS